MTEWAALLTCVAVAEMMALAGLVAWVGHADRGVTRPRSGRQPRFRRIRVWTFPPNLTARAFCMRPGRSFLPSPQLCLPRVHGRQNEQRAEECLGETFP